MDQIERAKRNAIITHEWTEGRTLLDIADRYGLTKQRIHQIILDNPQYAQNARYRKQILSDSKRLRTCKHCETEFYVESTDKRKPYYCSVACRTEGFGEMRADTADMHYKYINAMEMRACGEPWPDIALVLGYASGNSCRVALYRYSKKMGLLFDKKWIKNLNR